jgi:hypothetical protein
VGNGVQERLGAPNFIEKGSRFECFYIIFIFWNVWGERSYTGILWPCVVAANSLKNIEIR